VAGYGTDKFVKTFFRGSQEVDDVFSAGLNERGVHEYFVDIGNVIFRQPLQAKIRRGLKSHHNLLS
jgi:hypothetical protein